MAQNNSYSLLDLIRGFVGTKAGIKNPFGFIHIEQSGRTNSGERVDVDNLLREPTTMTCINIIVQGINQVPWGIKKKTDQGLVHLPKHPMSLLLNRPNVYQTAAELKSSIVSTILIHGNAFINIIRDGKDGKVGRPMQLVPIDPSDITIGVNNFGIPTYDHDHLGPLMAENVIHIRDLTTYDPLGYSRLLLAAEIIGAKIAADRLMSEHFKDGISINYAIETAAKVSPIEKGKIIQDMQTAFGRGGDRRGSAMIVEGGQLKAVKGVTPADSDLRELRKDLIEEICGAMKVPSYLAGGDGDEKYNNVKQKLTSLHRDTLYPIMNNIQEAMSAKLLDDYEECVYFDTTELLKGDTDGQSKYVQSLVTSGVLSVNEGREYLGYKKLDDEEFDMPKSSTSSMPEDDPRDATGGGDGAQGNENQPGGDDAE